MEARGFWRKEADGTKDCMYYIPILETLQTLQDVLAEVW